MSQLPPKPQPHSHPLPPPPPGVPMGKPGPANGIVPRTSGLAIASLVMGLLSLVLTCFTALFGIVFGIIALVQISGSQGRLKGTGFAIAGLICSILFSMLAPLALLPAVTQLRSAARDTVAENNMRIMAIAHHQYHDTYRYLPKDICDESGKPLLSWRVAILPFIEQNALYERFKLDEPWDSPHNLALAEYMPNVFERPGADDVPFNETVFQHPVGNGAMFFPARPGGASKTTFGSVMDGLANTIMIVETHPADSVIWTKPDDYVFDPQNPSRGLGGASPRGVALFSMGDASVRQVNVEIIDPEILSRTFTASGGEVGGF